MEVAGHLHSTRAQVSLLLIVRDFQQLEGQAVLGLAEQERIVPVQIIPIMARFPRLQEPVWLTPLTLQLIIQMGCRLQMGLLLTEYKR